MALTARFIVGANQNLHRFRRRDRRQLAQFGLLTVVIDVQPIHQRGAGASAANAVQILLENREGRFHLLASFVENVIDYIISHRFFQRAMCPKRRAPPVELSKVTTC